MATDGNSVDQAGESLQKLTIDTQASSGESQGLNKDAIRNDRDAQTSNNAQAPPVLQPPQHPTVQLPSESAVDAGLYYAPGNFASPTYYYPGYEMPPPEWEEYPRYINADGTEGSSPGFFAENGSVLYHPGYAYASQVAYAPYSPAASPLNPVRPEAHLYAPQHFQYPSHFYQQPLSPGVQQFLPSHNPPQGEISNVGGEHSIFAGDIANMNYANMNNISGPARPGYPMSPVSFGSFCQGGMAVTIPSPMYDGMRIGNTFPDSPNIVDVQQRPYNTSNSTIITQTPGIQQQRQLAVIGPASVTSYNRGFSSNRTYTQTNSSGRLSPGIQSNGRASWVPVDKSKSKGRPASASCNCVGAIDGFDEQNKGPRVKSKSQVLSSAVGESKEHGLTTDAMSEDPVVNREQYNRPDFLTEYNDARFFIIKSYSEDNIHKSIKYGVWASTPNGNKRLDAAFKEVKEKADGSPIFLFFSVNASGQFCGVAEMLGPVDFERSVDYWQQDKWSGQFPVRWHIVKDVPNNLFRHITLENNENKPVTNSRDTQDVPLEKGLQMLDIFKNHVSKTSILDDFDFYESRQKLMQDKKAKQQEFNESRSYDQTKSVTLKDYPNDGVISTNINQAIPEQAFSNERQLNLESDCKRSEHVVAGVIAAIEPKSAVESKEVPPM